MNNRCPKGISNMFFKYIHNIQNFLHISSKTERRNSKVQLTNFEEKNCLPQKFSILTQNACLEIGRTKLQNSGNTELITEKPHIAT